MRRKGLWAILPLMAAVPVLASGGGWLAPLWGVPTIVWQVFNLAIVVGMLFFLLRKSAPAFFSSRSEGIRKELERALRDKEAALARLAEVEAKMAHLEGEVAAIEKESAASAEADRVRMLAEAEAARERLGAEAREELAHRTAAARRELRAYAASLVERLAREEIRRSLTPSDEDALMEEFLRRLEEEAHERIG